MRALSIEKYSNLYRACSIFTNLDLFCIDNARVMYKKIRYILPPDYGLQMGLKHIEVW
jgi:hypothetical protein